jgi:hypothetical protein
MIVSFRKRKLVGLMRMRHRINAVRKLTHSILHAAITCAVLSDFFVF